MRERPFTAGVVLAAGSSRRMGMPKQLLPLGGTTLLGRVIEQARACRLDQLLCTLGPQRERIAAAVDLGGVETVAVAGAEDGCAASIGAAVAALDPRCATLVVLLGDQPGAAPATVEALLAGRGAAPAAVCRYDDGRGHPLALGRELFGELRALRGDKAVWKLLDRLGAAVAEVPVPGPAPRDVDTPADYAALLAAEARAAGRADSPGQPVGAAGPPRRPELAGQPERASPPAPAGPAPAGPAPAKAARR